MSTRFFVLAALCVPALAQAEPFPDSSVTVHVVAGAEMLGGGGGFSAGFRGHALVGSSIGSRSVRPSFAVGGTFGSGYLSVSDMRALDGSVSLALTTFGPEAQLGLRFANGGHVDNRIYGSFAVLHVNKDRRLALDAVPGVSDSNQRGYRASFGASWIDALVSKASETPYRRDDMADILTILLPSQAELAFERDAGSARYGVMLGWGL
jgi:hypothetical protein